MHMSRCVTFRLQNDNLITFSIDSCDMPTLPSEEQLSKNNITYVQLSGESYAEHEWGITPVAEDFGAVKDGIIRRIPEYFQVQEKNNIYYLEFGRYDIYPEVLEKAEKSGIAGYWKQDSIVIASNKQYKMLLYMLHKLIKPNQSRFGFWSGDCIGGQDLRIRQL